LKSDIKNGTADDFIIEDGVLISYNGKDNIVTVPDGVNTIGENAFQGNPHIRRVILPPTVMRIEKSAFEGCRYLSSILLPPSLTIIEDGAFRGCSILKSVSIPGSVLKIGDFAFHSCNCLEFVKFHPGLQSIGNYAFAFCMNIRSMFIPASVKFIGMAAFVCCSRLIWLNLPEELNKTPFLSLSGCDRICKVKLTGEKADIVNKARGRCLDSLIKKQEEGDTPALNLLELNTLPCEYKGKPLHSKFCYHNLFRDRYTEAFDYLVSQPSIMTELTEKKVLSRSEADFLLHNEKTSIECRAILMEYLLGIQ